MKKKKKYFQLISKQVNSFFIIIKSYLHMLQMAKKPNKKEYFFIIKISLIGILFVGTIGFLFYLIMDYIPKMV